MTLTPDMPRSSCRRTRCRAWRVGPRPERLSDGFTLIELIVAVGIIVILSGILLIAVKGIGTSSKTHQTRMALNNAKSLLANMDAINRLGPGPGQWWWWRGGPMVDPSKGTGDLTYWSRPDPTPTQWDPTIVVSGGPPSLDAPGIVRDEPLQEAVVYRNASHAVINTSVVMGMLAGIPANRTALANLPASQIYNIEWQPANPQLMGPGADGWLKMATDTNEQIQYIAGCHVRGPDGKGYVCRVSAPAGGAPTAGNNWALDTIAAPLLRDGWGNPIIFVPATGLNVRMLNGKSAYDPNDNTQKFIAISPEGQVSGNGTNSPTVVRAGKPFFASAGPDGDFSTGDDNIYSFEQ